MTVFTNEPQGTPTHVTYFPHKTCYQTEANLLYTQTLHTHTVYCTYHIGAKTYNLVIIFLLLQEQVFTLVQNVTEYQLNAV